jgi:hypothetical protein
MYPHGAKLRSALLEQHLLPLLATIGFKNHEFDAARSCVCNHSFDGSARNGLQQRGIGNPILRMKSRIRLNHVVKKISHN